WRGGPENEEGGSGGLRSGPQRNRACHKLNSGRTVGGRSSRRISRLGTSNALPRRRPITGVHTRCQAPNGVGLSVTTDGFFRTGLGDALLRLSPGTATRWCSLQRLPQRPPFPLP